ncbi:hypothetical protein [Thermoplasma sp. Kam2015]|uniref:hypothetical protein n=1 Tax=Thermoplasma sp. Kam2015 TaxID=2094122 RepID=UPI00137B10A8|nr:hypothetical protein [Thermoplasma sp. Kam2015]
MDEFTDAECLKRINDAIYLNNTRGKKGRKERDRECDELLLRYFDQCRYTDLKNIVKFDVFSEATTTMIQAIESYRIGMFDACMVMLRNTIDAIMFVALNYEVIFNDQKTAVWYLKPIDGISRFENYKKWDKRIEALKEKKFINDKDAGKLGEIHEAGHFSAHYFLKGKQNMRKFIERKVKLQNNNIGKYPKTFTTEKECRENLNDAFDILEKLINNYVLSQITK